VAKTQLITKYVQRVLILHFVIVFNSISSTAPAENSENGNNNSNNFDDDYDYDDYDDKDISNNPEIAANRQLDITSSTTTTTYRPIFSKFHK